MVQGTVEGTDEFKEFADGVGAASQRVDEAIDRAIRLTIDDFVEEVTRRIDAASTSKGGTLDSRTSPYSPGGMNDSTDSNVHISDKDAWTHIRPNKRTGVVMPRASARDRAYWMEKGTPAHGPSGDQPMYFHLNGVRIVVLEEQEGTPPAAIQSLAEDGELQDFLEEHGVPGQVDGVQPNNFFEEAALELHQNRTFSGHLERQLELVVAEELGIKRKVSI